jgi:hypothetical protein
MLMRAWGLESAKQALEYPCDRYLPDADDAWFRGIEIAAPISRVTRARAIFMHTAVSYVVRPAPRVCS